MCVPAIRVTVRVYNVLQKGRSFTPQYSMEQGSGVLCITVEINGVFYSVVQCRSVQCSAQQYSAGSNIQTNIFRIYFSPVLNYKII